MKWPSGRKPSSSFQITRAMSNSRASKNWHHFSQKKMHIPLAVTGTLRYNAAENRRFQAKIGASAGVIGKVRIV